MAVPLVTRNTGDVIPAADHNDILPYVQDGTYRVNTSYLSLPVLDMADSTAFSLSLVQQLGTELYVKAIICLGSGIMLAGTANTGYVYRSTDSGATWTQITRLGNATTVTSFAYLGSGIVVAGVGGGAGGAKIYRSTDYGATWNSGTAQLGTETSVQSLVYCGGALAVAGTSQTGRIYRTGDSGASWGLVTRLGSETYINALAYLPEGIVLAGTGDLGNIYKSTDYGAIWGAAVRLGSETNVFALANMGSGVVLAGSYPSGKVFKSTNSGTSWNSGTQLGSETYVNCISPLDSGIALAGTGQNGYIYRTLNYGTTWTMIQQLSALYVNTIGVAENLVLAGTGSAAGYVYRNLNEGLIGFDTVNSQLKFTNNGGASWSPVKNTSIIAAAGTIDVTTNPVQHNNLVTYDSVSSKWVKAVNVIPQGICTNIKSDGSGMIQTSGLVSGVSLSSMATPTSSPQQLIPGEFYWSDNLGGIINSGTGSAPYLSAIKVGYAISESDLLLDIDLNTDFTYSNSTLAYSFVGSGSGASYTVTGTMDYISATTLTGNTTTTGGTTLCTGWTSSITGDIYGFYGGGNSSTSNPTYYNYVEYITLATTTQSASSRTTLSSIRNSMSGLGGGYGNPYGFWCAGRYTNPSSVYFTLIEYINTTTLTGGVITTGDITTARYGAAAITGSARGYGFICGGHSATAGVSGLLSNIQYINLSIATQNALSTGAMTAAYYFSTGINASNTDAYGFICGGTDESVAFNTVQSLNVFTGVQNAVNKGTLASVRQGSQGSRRKNRGLLSAGANTGGFINTLEYINTITTTISGVAMGTRVSGSWHGSGGGL